MTTEKLAQTALDVLNALLPLLPIGGIILVYRYFDKQSRGRTDDTKKLNELTNALAVLWPRISENAVAVDLIASHPSAYFVVTKHLAETKAKAAIKERFNTK